jgi:CRISPR-associated protein Csn2
LAHYDLNDPIQFTDGSINVVVIENQRLMRKLVEDLLTQSGGSDGGFSLAENGESISISGKVEVIVDPFSADINERNLLNKMFARMKKDSLDDEMYMSTNALLSEISTSIQKIMDRQSIQLECDDPDIGDLFKMMGVRFITSELLTERLCDYIDVCSEYRGTRLFVFVNLRSFLDKAEIKDLYVHSLYHKNRILLIENKQHVAIDCETVRIIDENLCEIPVSGVNDIY